MTHILSKHIFPLLIIRIYVIVLTNHKHRNTLLDLLIYCNNTYPTLKSFSTDVTRQPSLLLLLSVC